MKRFAVVVMITLAAFVGAAFAADEEGPMRFEFAAGTGWPTVLSGPDIQDQTNIVGRIGFYPSKHFMLTLTYDAWDAAIAEDDILNSVFAEEYRNSVHSNVNFNDALLDDATIDLTQWELGLVKTIALGENKRFETYIGLGMGLQDATAEIQWKGATKRILQGPNAGQIVPYDAELPPEMSEESNVFFVSVRGGMHWMPVRWFGLELDLRLVPIDSVFDQSLNTLELNAGVLFRFGKF